MPASQPTVTGPPESLWTLNEVSEYFRESPQTTRRRVARGDLSPAAYPAAGVSCSIQSRSADWPG